MNIGSIRITQTYGRIGIRQYPAKINIEQNLPNADIMQHKAELKIENILPKVYIDQSECFAELGIKTALRLTKDFYDESLRAGLESISKIAQEGERLMRIEDGGDPIIEIAEESMYEELCEINVDIAPKSRPQIEVREGKAEIEVKPMPPIINWAVYPKANIDATRHKVDIYMEVWPDIKFEYVGNNIDREI